MGYELIWATMHTKHPLIGIVITDSNSPAATLAALAIQQGAVAVQKQSTSSLS